MGVPALAGLGAVYASERARAMAIGAHTQTSEREAFAFGLIGDLPYLDSDEYNLSALIDEMNADALTCVIHVGDIKTSMETCSDERYARRKALMQRSAHPFVLLPGDNDWTDCHRTPSGGYDPRERLAALRQIFWSTPFALGRPDIAGRRAARLERQEGLPENVRWQIGGVHFIGLHVVGSSNGLDKYPGSRSEFESRDAANQHWLHESVATAMAARADALVLAFHANPGFDRTPPPGFVGFMRGLRQTASAFSGPILLLHGDSHRYRVDRPLRDEQGRLFEHVTRVECFGSPFTQSWVRIAYDPALPARFRIVPLQLRARVTP